MKAATAKALAREVSFAADFARSLGHKYIILFFEDKRPWYSNGRVFSFSQDTPENRAYWQGKGALVAGRVTKKGIFLPNRRALQSA